jgi:RimJ/RimL family protein N-acetyltransferase
LTGDLLLRDVTEGDLPILFEHQLDPKANQMAGFPARDRDEFVAHWTTVLGDETVTKKAIVLDGHVVGNVVSFEQDGLREIGYWIGRDHWGHGVATRALAMFLGQVKARPLHAHVAKHNVASLRVLAKCGFTVAGEDRRASSADGDEVEEYVLKLEG